MSSAPRVVRNKSETANYAFMARNSKDLALEEELIRRGWRRASHQHYSKLIKRREIAIDQHIGHFCVGIGTPNTAPTETTKYTQLADACTAALNLEATL